MRKAIIALAIIVAASSFVHAEDFVMIKKKAAAGASPFNIGNTLDTGTAGPWQPKTNTFRYQASASGTLQTAYLWHNGTNNETAIVSVYLDNGDATPAAEDTLVAASASIASGSSQGWKTGAFSAGTITSGSYYWIVIAASSAVWTGNGRTVASGSFGNASDYSGGLADLGTGTWGAPTTREYQVYVVAQ